MIHIIYVVYTVALIIYTIIAAGVVIGAITLYFATRNDNMFKTTSNPKPEPKSEDHTLWVSKTNLSVWLKVWTSNCVVCIHPGSCNLRRVGESVSLPWNDLVPFKGQITLTED